MYNHHDKLNIMGTEEILKKNVYDLQEQVVTANKRIVALLSIVDGLKNTMEDMDYYLKGITIYTEDINRLIKNGGRG